MNVPVAPLAVPGQQHRPGAGQRQRPGAAQRPRQRQRRPAARDERAAARPRVTVRADVNVPVVASVPPFSVTAFAASPRLVSALTLSVPAVIVSPPVYVLRPGQQRASRRRSASARRCRSAPPTASASSPLSGLNAPPPSVTARAEVNVAVALQRPAVQRHRVRRVAEVGVRAHAQRAGRDRVRRP